MKTHPVFLLTGALLVGFVVPDALGQVRNLRMGFLDSGRDERHAGRQFAQKSWSPPARNCSAAVVAPRAMVVTRSVRQASLSG